VRAPPPSDRPRRPPRPAAGLAAVAAATALAATLGTPVPGSSRAATSTPPAPPLAGPGDVRAPPAGRLDPDALGAVPDGWRDAGWPGIRGLTVGPVESVREPGHGYGTAAAGETLDALAELGASWVSLTPFGRLWSLDDTVVKPDFEAARDANGAAVRETIRQAHARGLRVLVIPHLWVETGGWRGDVEPGSPAAWAAYQDSYEAFVLGWADEAEAAGADAFSIGVECKSWSNRFPARWATLIDRVRGRFGGLLTYSANWDEVERVVFWDHLDLIGVNSFTPLAAEGGADYATYVAGARAWADRLEDVATTWGMPVVFVEVGYTARPDAAVEPWLWPDGMRDVVVDEVEQARALTATFEAFLPRPWFVGFFVWRYYANLDDVSQEAAWGFSPRGKLAAPILGEVFALPWAVDPAPLPGASPGRAASPPSWPLLRRLAEAEGRRGDLRGPAGPAR